jgi:xylulokinase/glycerol kinase
MSGEEHVIALDVGTMSIRAIIYATDGRALFESSYEYEAKFTPPGLVEQDPADWRLGLLNVLAEAGAYAREHTLAIACLAITSQRASVIPVDATGFPLHHAVTWQDKRSAPQVGTLVEAMGFGELYRLTGLRPNPYFSLPKMMWFREERPDVYRSAEKLLGVQDYVVYLLTGQFVTDWTQAARTMLLGIETFEWEQSILEASGIDSSKLPDLVAPGSSVEGGLRRSMARPVNLPEGLPVIVCGGDQQCAALALNVFSPGHAEANTGTGTFTIAHSERPAHHAEAKILCSASAVPGKWILEAGVFNTGAIYRWLRGHYGGPAAIGYPQMDALAAESPIGANGVVLLPHFEGSAAPNWNDLAKGVLFNLSIGTSRGDICRAVLEGISLEIAENLEIIEGAAGPVDELTVAGGMSTSPVFNQIQADATGHAVIRYENPEATSLGAVMSSLVSLGAVGTYEEAFRTVCPGEGARLVPDAQAHQTYREILDRRRVLYTALDRGGVYERFAPAL